MNEKNIIDIICNTKDEIESILTNENVIDFDQLEGCLRCLSDWTKQACFNKKEVKEEDYVPLTHTQFNERYSKLFNIQLVEDGFFSYKLVPKELIAKWEKWKEEAENNKDS